MLSYIISYMHTYIFKRKKVSAWICINTPKCGWASFVDAQQSAVTLSPLAKYSKTPPCATTTHLTV